MVIFWVLLAAGFVACVTLGSVAWYASKRPPGWEGAERPGWVNAITPQPLKQDSDA